jgi:hypothetical protein
VGVLRSDDFGTLRKGYFVVFSGQYDTQSAAQRAADGLRTSAPGAYARYVAPQG